MKEVRGKASGKIVNELLEEKIKNIIKKWKNDTGFS
jgi:Glu-tRNA(Gln) amidotransferase subunit E-like FAD-binding protein